MSKEKASTAVISIVSGVVSAKQIEMEFMNIVGSDIWRWTARPVNENTFVMRFHNAKWQRSGVTSKP